MARRRSRKGSHCYRSTKHGKPSKRGRYVTCRKHGKRVTRKRSKR